MDNFKQASKQGLRFQTSKGLLNVEQLWGLPLPELDTLAVQLQEEYENSKGKSFLTKRTVKDRTIKLQFDITLDILQTKVQEAEDARQKSEDKEHNKKILDVIAGKQDKALEGKSITQLEGMLR